MARERDVTRVTAPHGTSSRYVNARCRCEPCRAANTEYWRGFRLANKQRRLASGATPYVAEGVTHGITGYQSYSCRCEVCMLANRTKSARQRRRKAGV